MGVVAAGGQFGLGIVYFTSQQVEVLFQVREQDGHLEFDRNHGVSVLTLGLYFLDIGQSAQLLFHDLGYFELYFVGVGSRPGYHNHGLFGGHGRVFELGICMNARTPAMMIPAINDQKRVGRLIKNRVIFITAVLLHWLAIRVR